MVGRKLSRPSHYACMPIFHVSIGGWLRTPLRAERTHAGCEYGVQTPTQRHSFTPYRGIHTKATQFVPNYLLGALSDTSLSNEQVCLVL